MASTLTGARRRIRLEVRGAVQGVGFRPFVYRLATSLGLDGFVLNDSAGVCIEVEGDAETVEQFTARLSAELPPRATIDELRLASVELEGVAGFSIRRSGSAGVPTAVVLPDLATCDDCLREIFDALDRRSGYAFTNCTNCGPRYSIIRALPYDRPNTTMASFVMCERCRAEYENPLDRRFHAQPNACPRCGPRVSLLGSDGTSLALDDDDDVFAAAARVLERGATLAVKGIGGFHLMVDARNEEGVRRLRARKHRWAKPLALMVADVAAARELCEVSADEADLLTSPEAPIMLMERLADPLTAIAESVAPGMGRLGVMLAYAPIQHILLDRFRAPLVATSGNLSEEPICIDEHDAVQRLAGIADAFLVHDRPIQRHVDDSVACVTRGGRQLLRRARGFAPLPVRLPFDVPPLLAVGAHQKNTIALATGRQAFVSQHIGDLDSPQSLAAFEQVIDDLARLYQVRPVAIAHDLHPAYASSTYAVRSPRWRMELDRIGVQHHHAHLASCLAENGVTGPALGIIWDGSGMGAVDGLSDGTVWGGEFLVGDARSFERVAHLRPFRLPGGEAAVREPRRVALAMLHDLLGDAAFERIDLAPVAAFEVSDRRLIASMIRNGVRSPITTSAGRLFDGVAALLGVCQRSQFEGEAAMLLEQLVDPAERGAYEITFERGQIGSSARLDWRPLIVSIIDDLARGTDRSIIAARFHHALVDSMVAVARHAAQPRVALSGGCFQNRRLAETGAAALERSGFEVVTHHLVPPNDGGISLGQIAIAAARLDHQH